MTNKGAEELLTFLGTLPFIVWGALYLDKEGKIKRSLLTSLENGDCSIPDFNYKLLKEEIGISGIYFALDFMVEKMSKEMERGKSLVSKTLLEPLRKITLEDIMEARNSLACALCFSDDNAFLSITENMKNSLKEILKDKYEEIIDPIQKQSETAFNLAKDYISMKVSQGLAASPALDGEEEKLLHSLIGEATLFVDKEKLQVLKMIELTMYSLPLIQELNEDPLKAIDIYD